MKNILLSIICLLTFSMASWAQFADYTFFEGKYDQLQTRALNSQKPYFVFFYANWSQQSKKMFEETFNDADLVAYAEANYLGIALDGESIITNGQELAQRHNIMYFPSVLIFTPEGKLVKRMNGFSSADQLKAALQNHVNMKGNPELAILQEEEPEPVTVEGEYLFKVSAKMLPRIGYGVQLAAYSTYRSTFEKLLELENQKFHHNIMTFIEEDAQTGELLYKLILGPFSTQDQAQKYQQLLNQKDKKYYGNSLVVDLTSM